MLFRPHGNGVRVVSSSLNYLDELTLVQASKGPSNRAALCELSSPVAH
jgi:hypothetical protein